MSGAFKISKEGFVLLQFAPAAGVRQYDWSRKQVFSLTVVEIGTLISLGMKDGCEFFHDPFKGRSDEGKVKKVLKVEPLPDGSGHFFNLSVQNRILNMDESIYIPVTRAEFAVLVEGFKFILPYLMDWNASASTIKPEDASRTNSANPRPGPDYESMSGADSIASNDHGVVLNWNLLPVFIWCGYVIDFMTTWSQGVGSDLGLLRKGRISGLLDPVSIFCFFPFLSSFKETLLSILLTCVLNAL